MVEYLASPANRHLGTRATVLGATNSLENINTASVMDGALCYVQASGGYYLLDKSSTLDPTTFGFAYIVKPIAGPGRWLLMPGSGNAGPGIALTVQQNQATGTVTISNSDKWAEMTTGTFTYLNVLPSGLGDALFSFTAPSPAITYNGPGRVFKIWTIASIESADATTPEIVEIGADINGALVGTTTGLDSTQRLQLADDSDIQIFTACRVSLLAAGDVVNAIFRNHTAAHDLSLAYFTLMLDAA